MQRQWKVRRIMQPSPDGQRRWDRAYQELLAWSRAGFGDERRDGAVPDLSDLEVNGESSPVCPCLDPKAGTSPDGRAATGTTKEIRRRARLVRPD